MKIFNLIILLVLLISTPSFGATYIFTDNSAGGVGGTYDYTIGKGVYQVQAECIGGGGGGGQGADGLLEGGGGGGGGGYSRVNNIDVVKGDVLNLTFGAGGTAGNGGGHSQVTLNGGSVLCKANGGQHGNNFMEFGNGSGGQAGDGIGDVKYSGGSGYDPLSIFEPDGGGGGSAAFPSGNGNSGTGTGVGGGAASAGDYSGYGGDGGYLDHFSSTAAVDGGGPDGYYGGGGGGSDDGRGGGSINGANGFGGAVILTFLTHRILCAFGGSFAGTTDNKGPMYYWDGASWKIGKLMRWNGSYWQGPD